MRTNIPVRTIVRSYSRGQFNQNQIQMAQARVVPTVPVQPVVQPRPVVVQAQPVVQQYAQPQPVAYAPAQPVAYPVAGVQVGAVQQAQQMQTCTTTTTTTTSTQQQQMQQGMQMQQPMVPVDTTGDGKADTYMPMGQAMK